MSSGTRKRKRAVALNVEGIQLVQDALVQRCQEISPGSKLTREQRADLLGLSIGTADRVMKGQGVDRASLTLAFSNLGLAWREEYLAGEEVSAPPFAAEEVSIPHIEPERRRASGLLGQLAVGLAAVVIAGGFWVQSSQPPRQDTPFYQLYEAGLAKFHDADYEEAEILLRRALQQARAENNAARLRECVLILGQSAEAKGRLNDALERYDEAITYGKVLNPDDPIPEHYEALGVVYGKLGRFEEAEKALDQSVQAAFRRKSANCLAQARRSLGELHIRKGDFKRAATPLEQSLRTCHELKNDGLAADVKGLLAIVRAKDGKVDEARQLARESSRFWLDKRHPRWIARTMFRSGIVEMLAGHPELSKGFFEESRSGFIAIGDEYGSREAAAWLSRFEEPKARPVSLRARD